MFNKKLVDIFTYNNLNFAFKSISSVSKGLDGVSYIEFSKNLSQNLNTLKNDILNKKYIPEPIKKIQIKKENKNEFRPISITSIKDKIVQKTLYNEIYLYFNKNFLSNSYAYRPGKSAVTAINRTTSYIDQGNVWIFKTDIKDFFESINHYKLLRILERHIEDKNIINLITTFIKTGGFQKETFQAHNKGVHQGDILSPLLSNIYLDLMDKFLQRNDINFIRFADDFAMFFDEKDKAIKFKPKLINMLKTIDLSLNLDKTNIVHIDSGFTFLGIHFIGNTRLVDSKKLDNVIRNFTNLASKNSKFMTYIQEINEFLEGLKNYYLKIIKPNSPQHLLLQEAVIKSISHKVFLTKKASTTTNKNELRSFINQIQLNLIFSPNIIKQTVELIIQKGYNKINSSKTNITSKINDKRNAYAKKIAHNQTLIINQKAIYLGVSKNTITLKKYGKLYKKFPLYQIKHIIIEDISVSISAAFVKRCTRENIHISFIDKLANPYAILTTYKATTTQAIHKQALILGTKKQLYLAKSFIFSKAKNQINYIKYLNKYHKILDQNIIKSQKFIPKILAAKTVPELMGYEGSLSAIYWDCIKTILSAPFDGRITYQARDIVNSSLNYAYAILYTKIRYYLIVAGLSLHISFLHALDERKPTLSFDMIEEFRTFIVDRVIVSMINKNEPMALNKDGFLNDKTKKLIAQNINEKLGSYITYKKQVVKVESIIEKQCYALSNFINEKSSSYKSFIGKF